MAAAMPSPYTPDLSVRITFVQHKHRPSLARWPGLYNVIKIEFAGQKPLYKFSLDGLMAN